MNHYNQSQSKDNKNIKKVVFGTVVTAMAALTLAACGNTNASATKNSSDTSPKTSQQEKNSATPEGSNANGNIDNTPTTLQEFENTIEAAGLTIISGQDEDGKQISGATTEENGTFYANVEIDNNDGNVAYNSNMWGVSIPSLGISSSFGNLGSSDGELATWIKSHENNTQTN